jgi:hypothetical protein
LRSCGFDESQPFFRAREIITRGITSLLPKREAESTPAIELHKEELSSPSVRVDLLENLNHNEMIQKLKQDVLPEVKKQVLIHLLDKEVDSLRVFSPALDVITIVSLDSHGNESSNAVSATWKTAEQISKQLEVEVESSSNLGYTQIHVHERPLEQSVRYALREMGKVRSHLSSEDPYIAFQDQRDEEYHIRSGEGTVEMTIDQDYPFGNHSIKVDGNALFIAVKHPDDQQDRLLSVAESSVTVFDGLNTFTTKDLSTVGTAKLLLADLYTMAQTLPQRDGGVY